MDDPGMPPVLDPEDNPLAARLALHVKSWGARIPAWNGQVTDYNPSGRRFKRKELQLMAQQHAFDQAGVSGFTAAKTAHELLERAKVVAKLGR